MKTIAPSLCLLLAGTASATVLVDNLAEPIQNPAHVRNEFWSAQSFITPGGGAWSTLESLTLRLGVLTDSPAISAELRADSASGPGALLTTFTLPPLDTGPTRNELLLPTTSVTLAPESTYWVVLSVSGPGSLDWSYSATNGYSGEGSFGYYAYSLNQGALWQDFGLEGPYLMRVVTAVPEVAPATLLLSGLALLGWLGSRRQTRP